MKQRFAIASFIVLLLTAGSGLAAPTWIFDDPCDTVPLHNVEHCIVVLRDGLLKVVSTGTDPYFFPGGGWDFADWEPFDGATYSTIYMRLKVNITSTWQVYYITEENGEWGEEQQQDFDLEAADDFVDVAIVMERGGWQEHTIKGLLIGPGKTAGVIAEIDYISLEVPVAAVESGGMSSREDNVPVCLVGLLEDNLFERGFIVFAPTSWDSRTIQGTLQLSPVNGAPIWNLIQDSSRFSLAGAEAELLQSGAVRFFDGAKAVIVGPPGSAEADLILALDACIEYQNRVPEPGDAWPDLYVGQNMRNRPALAELQEVHLRLNYRLLKSEAAELPDLNPEVHVAQFLFYIGVENLNNKSSGFGDYFYFGLNLYDTRHLLAPAYAERDFSTPKVRGTGKFIFQPDMMRLTQESAHDGAWISIDADLLPLIFEGIEAAWDRGYLEDSRNLADYRLSWASIGWEVTGPLDVAMQLKDLHLEAMVTPGLYTPWLLLDISDQTIPSDGADKFAGIHLDDHIYDFGSGDAEMIWTYSGNTALSVNISGDNIATIAVPDPCWSGSETITFTATAPDGESKNDSATFTMLPSKTAYITPSTIALEIGETQQFLVSVYTSNDQKCEITNSDVLWTVEGDIGSIDAEGLFTAKSVGSGSIKTTLRADTSVVAQSNTVTVKYPPWDVNGDGMVDISDLMLVGNAFGMSGEGLSADVNADGVVDILDLITVAMHYGESTNLVAPSATRQPSSAHTNMLEQWLKAARAADDGSEMFRRGIAAVELLLINIIPEQTALLQNYPNPFNPDTWIPYQLREDSDVIIKIYTSTGQLVRTLNLGHKSAGVYTGKEKAAYWDGKNKEGEKTGSGIYFYNIQAGDFTATKKMTIVE